MSNRAGPKQYSKKQTQQPRKAFNYEEFYGKTPILKNLLKGYDKVVKTFKPDYERLR
jgi:hypothetical protein|tara:strand:- start:318 stop:488 length:171 start_codon:yes stop_codon:yes gene_type:complete